MRPVLAPRFDGAKPRKSATSYGLPGDKGMTHRRPCQPVRLADLRRASHRPGLLLLLRHEQDPLQDLNCLVLQPQAETFGSAGVVAAACAGLVAAAPARPAGVEVLGASGAGVQVEQAAVFGRSCQRRRLVRLARGRVPGQQPGMVRTRSAADAPEMRRWARSLPPNRAGRPAFRQRAGVMRLRRQYREAEAVLLPGSKPRSSNRRAASRMPTPGRAPVYLPAPTALLTGR